MIRLGFRHEREPQRRVARSTGMTRALEPDAELNALRAEVAHLRRVNQELLATVTELGATVDRLQAHIDKLA